MNESKNVIVMPKVPSVIKEKASELVTQDNSRFIS